MYNSLGACLAAAACLGLLPHAAYRKMHSGIQALEVNLTIVSADGCWPDLLSCWLAEFITLCLTWTRELLAALGDPD